MSWDPALDLARRLPVLGPVADWTLEKRNRTWGSHHVLVILASLAGFGAFALLEGWARWAVLVGMAVVVGYLVREAIAAAREEDRTVPKLVDHVMDSVYAIFGLGAAAAMVAGNWPAVLVIEFTLAVPVVLDLIDEAILDWVFRRISGRR